MDIRIGNDIRLDVSINEIGGYSASDIIKTVGRFIKMPPKQSHDKQFPESNCSSEYTVHGCGLPVYNVLPSKGNTKCIEQHRSHGLCVYEDENSPAKLSSDNKYIYSYFPAEHLKHSGNYVFVLQIWIKDESWDEGIRQYTILCGNLFNLTPIGASGSLTIRVSKTTTPDLYVSTLSDQQIANINNNYIQLMIDSVQYQLNTLPYSGIPVDIDNGDRVVILSKYNTLSVLYNGFIFPMSIIKISDSCYLYKSEYTYTKNEILLNIQNGTSPIYQETNAPSQDGPVQPEPSTPSLGGDTPSESTSASVSSNKLTADGTVVNNILTISGSISGHTLIL